MNITVTWSFVTDPMGSEWNTFTLEVDGLVIESNIL